MSSYTGMFVVIAEFLVAQDKRAEFLAAAAEDATSSVRDEPGCRHFEVLTSEESAVLILFYEIYDDRAAFDAHRETPHFEAFAKAAERLNAERTQLRFFKHR